MAAQDRGGIVAGVILIAIGVGLLALQYLPDVGGALVTGLVGVVFLGFALARKSYGLLIPGCILTGLGAGIAVEESGIFQLAEPVVLGLGLGFIAIWAIDALYTRSGNFWPLIPGGILLIVGLAESLPAAGAFVERWWPVALILAGLIAIVRTMSGPRAGHGAGAPGA